MRDIAFNLVPENIFVAPFQRFQTSHGRPVEVGNIVGLEDPIDSRGEAEFEGKAVNGANVLGLVAAAAALGTAAALKKEEGRLVVEVSSEQLYIAALNSCLQICSSFILQLKLRALALADLFQFRLSCLLAA